MMVIDLLKKLLEIDSTTGSEASVALFIHSYLQDHGFQVIRQNLSLDRFNIYARYGDPFITFSTHMDTVAPFFSYWEEETTLHGRGACDAKGILAAQIMAAIQLKHNGADSIGLLFVVGEEKNSDGARAANQLSNNSIYLINGEPTDNKLATGHKGQIRFLLETTGRAAHSAYPERGDSAIDALISVLYDIRQLQLPYDEKFGATTLNIGTISGGSQANVIAASARAEIMTRITKSLDVICQLLNETIDNRAVIDYLVQYDPILLETVDGIEQTTVAFGTDIPFLKNWGTPLMLGPGSILDAHSPTECIVKKEILKAVELYQQLYYKLYTRLQT